MTLPELNSEFSILWEDLTTNGTKGLDNYERSVCFTHAQEKMVMALANSNDPADLEELSAIITMEVVATAGAAGAYPTSVRYAFQDSVKILDRFLNSAGTNEQIFAEIVDIGQVKSMYRSAYKFPPKNLAYVVVGEAFDEVFPPLNYSQTSYTRRVINYPTPVILDTLVGDTINGLTAATAPILHEEQHRKLIEVAVNFAIEKYIGVKEEDVPNQ